MVTKAPATIEDLYRVPEHGKAELVDGELVLMSPTGDAPGRAGLEIVVSLRQYEKEGGQGRAYPDNVGFIVDLPNRRSFSPAAAFFTGRPAGMKFLEGAPVFAVEVRSEGDYGPAAERQMARKRADYFAAGTKVVWDVDLLGEDVVRSYRADDPEHPVVFRRGDLADAAPAMPGWRLAVDALFS